MGTLFIWMTTIAVVWSTIKYSIAEEIAATSSLPQIESGTNSDEYDTDSARKIIGSRVVTSVSVVMNGQEPQFADAVGNYIPRPLVPPRVASPVSLLDPDRYEFYTFNDNGDLVKRLMTMEEIQGIVANGDSDQQVLAKTPTGSIDNNNYNNNEASIQDIVNNVQMVLNREMANQNFTTNLINNKLHTPDTSSSWSSILPAIFGNTGETILANNNLPVTTGSTADSIIVHTTSKKPVSNKVAASTTTKGTVPPKTTTTKLSKQKPKPSSTRPSSISTSYGTTNYPSSHSTTVQKNKQTTSGTSLKTQNTVKNTLAPGNKFQNTQPITTFTPKPTKFVTVQKPSSLATKTSTAYIQKVSHGSSLIPSIASNRITASASNTHPTKPIGLAQTETYRPTTQNKVSSTVKIGSTPSISNTGYVTKSKIPETKPTKKNRIPETTFITTTPTKKKTTATKLNKKSTTPIPSVKYTTAKSSQDLSAAASTIKYVTVNAEPTTRKTLPPPIHPTTLAPKESSPGLAIFEPEPDNLFDSELSLNQIIESLQNLEGTTIPYPQSMTDFMDMTTFEPNSLPPLEKLNTESVVVHSNGQDTTTQSYLDNDLTFKQSMSSSVSYIPQTTAEYSSTSPFTEGYNRITTNTKKTTDRLPVSKPYMTIQHKESDDDMESVLDEKTTTEPNDITTTDINLSKQQVNGVDFLRESFDSVLSQVQNEDDMSSTTTTILDANGMETTTATGEATTLLAIEESTKMPTVEKKKKVVVKPTPYIAFDELEDGTEPMSYLETVVKYYENEKNENEMKNNNKNQNAIEKETEKKSTETTESTTFKESNEMSTDFDSMPTTTENFSNENSSSEMLRTETVLDSTENSSEDSVAITTELSTEEMLDAASRTDSLVDIENDEAMDSTTEGEERSSTIDFMRDSTDKQELSSMRTFTEKTDDITFSTRANDLTQSTTISLDEDDASSSTEAENTVSANDESTTISSEIENETDYENQANYEMVQLIEKIAKNLTNEERTTVNPIQRKEDTNLNENSTSNRNEIEFSDLGESLKPNVTSFVKVKPNRTLPTTTSKPTPTAKPTKWKLPTLAPILNNLKMKVVNALKNANAITLDLSAPKQALGLEETTLNAGDDILEFTRFCNELAFSFWNVFNDGGISSARSLVLSPFALTSMLSMLFLGARGRTSGEINDMLHLDDIVSFNPHAMFRNISESVDEKRNENVHTSAFVRELLSERTKGKILSFFKEKVQQFYSGYVEEVNFTTVNDIIRRRTNLLIKRYSGGKVNEYLKASNIWVKPPLSGISANVFETDCSKASKVERDGEMFFQVLPAIRQRRLIPIPAVVWKSGFTAGYDPELDATAVAIGNSKDAVSTIFVMPGQQGHSAPGDNLERLESVLMVNAVSKNAWRRLLTTLMERNGLEVQLPRFSHRSYVNVTSALRKLGLNTLFDSNEADLRGITGAAAHDMYVSDLVQINSFTTCGEDKLSEEHHTEMYPAPPNKHRNIEYTTPSLSSDGKSPSTLDYESERAFAADPLFDLKYLNLPLPLRPRQARIPEVRPRLETNRLRFDKPFLYFVRHNPSGMVLYFGRFNPRLLP